MYEHKIEIWSMDYQQMKNIRSLKRNGQHFEHDRLDMCSIYYCYYVHGHYTYFDVPTGPHSNWSSVPQSCCQVVSYRRCQGCVCVYVLVYVWVYV